MKFAKKLLRLPFVVASSLMLISCKPAEQQISEPSGLTVLLDAAVSGSWPTGLDPATNMTARGNLNIMGAIFGGLFQLTADDDGTNGRVVGVLAEDYAIADDGRAVVIRLRRGVTFSDGTPFDAEAVRFNIERSLSSACTCAPTMWPWAKDEPVTVADEHTVVLHFTQPYAAVINAFPIANINWIASPTALEAMGIEEFKMRPVGAGPFRVVSNQVSSRLVLERNPRYWQEGHPYLDRLVFQSIGSEQAAMQALLSGDAQVYEGMTSTPLLVRAKDDDRLIVTPQPGTSPYVIQLNTRRPPFDDKRAREAIYYATNVEAIRNGLFRGWYPVSQTFTGPGGLYHHGVVPGYRSYDLQKARAIVEEVGGIEITLGTIRSFVAEQVMTALQSQWREAGIEVSVETYELAPMIQKFRSGEWQVMLQTVGSFDPESGGGVSFRFRSDQPNTGVHDEHLDRILLAAAATFDPAERDRLYVKAAKHINDEAYAPFLFAFAPAQVATRGVSGPGLTTRIPPMLVNTGVHWQDVRMVSE